MSFDSKDLEEIKIPYDKVEILESSHSAKLIDNILSLTFNYYNVMGYVIKEIKKGFLGLSKSNTLSIFETCYNTENKIMVRITTIESIHKEILEEVATKIDRNSTKVKEIDIKISKMNKPYILNLKINKLLDKIIKNTERSLIKYPYNHNIFQKTISFKVEVYENEEDLIKFFREEFNTNELYIEDIYFDSKYKLKLITIQYNSSLDYFVEI